MSCIQQPSRCHWALLFDSRRTVARSLRAQWHATHVLLSLLIKTSRGGFMGYTGTDILMLFPRLSSIKHRSVPIKLPAFCIKYHYRLFCIFGITVVGPALSYRLARNSDFLSLLAGFFQWNEKDIPCNKYSQNTKYQKGKSFEYYIPIDIPCNGDPMKPWTGDILNKSCTKRVILRTGSLAISASKIGLF